jgi:hypothetical protein
LVSITASADPARSFGAPRDTESGLLTERVGRLALPRLLDPAAGAFVRGIEIGSCPLGSDATVAPARAVRLRSGLRAAAASLPTRRSVPYARMDSIMPDGASVIWPRTLCRPIPQAIRKAQSSLQKPAKRPFTSNLYLRRGLSKSSLHRVTNPATQCNKERPASVIWPSRYARSTANSTIVATAIKNHRIPDF